LLLDFSAPQNERDRLIVLIASWALWAIVVEVALRVYCLRGERSIPFTGPLPAMLALTAWMCTYHFMYYDVLLSAFGVCVLLADPRPFFRRQPLQPVGAEPGRRSVWLVNSFVLTMVMLLVLQENTTRQMRIEITGVVHSLTTARALPNGATEEAPRTLVVGTSDRYPVDTLIVLAIWAWSAVMSLAGVRSHPPRAASPAHGKPDGAIIA
jgi:hypothetical protein